MERGRIIDNVSNPLNQVYDAAMSTETEPQTVSTSALYLFHQSERLISPMFYVRVSHFPRVLYPRVSFPPCFISESLISPAFHV
jgi:hypothetical protein